MAQGDEPTAGAPAPIAETAAPIAPAPAPVAEAPPAPAPAEPAAEVAPVAEPVAEPTSELAPEVAPEPVPETEKPPEAPEPPTAIVYEAFKLPEGVQAAAEQVEAYTGLLNKYGLTQEAGQELMDLHAASLTQAAADMAQRQQDVFADTRRQWVKDFDKQAGNRRDTILNDAKWAIGNLFPKADERKAFNEVIAFTGVGDHPVMINALARVATKLRERNAPPTGISPRAAPQSAPDKRYGAPTKR